MRRKQYFAPPAGMALAEIPHPLTYTVTRRVRFEEVDPLRIVWHGRYPSYFEDARVALGDNYRIGYMDLFEHGAITPIKRMEVDYHSPLKFGDIMTIEARLHWCESARMNYEFIIRNQHNVVTTTGCSVQLFLTVNNELMLCPPDYYTAVLERWKQGIL